MWKILTLLVCIFYTNYVQAVYNVGIKTKVYDQQPIAQGNHNYHRDQFHQSYPITHRQHNQYSDANTDIDYQTPITQTHPDNTYQQPQRQLYEGDYYQQTPIGEEPQQQHRPHTPQQHNQHHQHSQQPEVQPTYKRTENSQIQPTGNWQNTENSVKDYYTGCPSGYTGQLPYAYDCRRFVNCWHGRGHIQTCSVGTVFNPESLECDRPDKVKCEAALGVLGAQSLGKSSQSPNEGSFKQSRQLNYRAGRYSDLSIDNNVEILCPAGAQGLKPHPTDCTRFINCANGNMHIQQCGPGTAYSISMEVCDFKNKVDCTDREGVDTSAIPRQANNAISCPSDASGLYPHPYDCSKFLQCSNGETFIQDCGPGTAFDSIRSLCDYKHKVKCCSGCTLPETETTVVTTAYTHEPTIPKTLSPTSNTQNEDLPHTADILCLAGLTGLFPYPFDYTKFIHCQHGNTAIQNCVPGTAFSISKGYCESLDEIAVSDRVMYIVSQVSYEYSQTLITCPPGTDGFHLYPFNAELFVKCIKSQMNIVPCNNAHVFSVTRRICLPLTQVLKHERVRLLSELKPMSNYRVSDEDYSVKNMVYCPAGSTGTYPHPFNSMKYLKCVRGRLMTESCASGQAFSLSRKVCTLKEEIKTNDYVPQAKSEYGQDWRITDIEITHGSIDGLTYLMCPPGLKGYFLHPFDCTKYIECAEGVTSVGSCLSGTVYSISRKECIPRDEVEAYDRVEYMTTIKNEFSNDPSNQHHHYDPSVSCNAGTFGIYPHPYDCNKYIRCANGRILVERCPTGQVFSLGRSYCHNENEVDNKDRSSVHRDFSTSQDPYQVPLTGASYTGTYNNINVNQSSFETSPERTISPPSAVLRPPPPYPVNSATDNNVNCPPGATGRYPHPFNCTKFLMCSNGKTHVQDCGPGTAWNKEMEVCDFKEKVGCQQSGASSSPVTTLSTNNYDTIKIPQLSLSPPPASSHLPHYNNAAIGDNLQCPLGASGRYAHPFDCTKFLMCSNGKTDVQQCGSGTAWNKEMEVCDFKEKVNCSPYTLPDSVASSAQNIEPQYHCRTGVEGIHEHPYDWHKYLICTHGQTTVMDCAPGTVFSLSRKICDTEANVLNSDRCNNGIYSSDYDYAYNQKPKNQESTTYGNSGVNTQWANAGTAQTKTTARVNENRWTTINEPRPGDSAYQQTPHTNTVNHNTPTGSDPLPGWYGTVVHVDQHNPTHTVINEEGSFEPNRNYDRPTYSTPLAPFKPTTTTTTKSTIVYAQPVGSQEDSQEIFSHTITQPINSYKSQYFPLSNRQNHTRHLNTWTPNRPVDVPRHNLMPSHQVQGTVYTSSHVQIPISSPIEPPYQSPQPSTQYPYNLPAAVRPQLQRPDPYYASEDSGQKPLSESDFKITSINIDQLPSQVTYDLNDFDQLPLSSSKHNTADISKLYESSQPDFANAKATTTTRNSLHAYEQTTQLPLPPKLTTSTSILPGYPQLSNATIQTFPRQPHYSPPYSEVAHSRNASWISRKIPQHSSVKPTYKDFLNYKQTNNSPSPEDERAAMTAALKLLLKPYINSESKVGAEGADKVQSHIMSLVSNSDQDNTTNIHQPSLNTNTIASGTTPHHEDVELLLTGEQHNLVGVTTTQTGSHENSTYYNLYQAPLQPDKSSSITPTTHTHDHNTNWHKYQSQDPHHLKLQHTREFHKKHPNLPNPFDDPSIENPYDLDLRAGSFCPFKCGNGKCIEQHEVCDGVNDCGNRRDEEDCGHLGYELRLTGGQSPNMGRVEVKILGKWGYVCDDKFGLRDADVVCRELGFKMGAMEVRGNSYYAPSDADVYFAMDEVQCRGNETSLTECDFKGWGVNNCGPDEVVGVVCKVPKLKCPDNYWLCSTSKECIPTAFLCDLTPDCEDGSDESSGVCNAPIKYRLEGGRSSNEGRLEVLYHGEWGTVCDDDFGLKEAQVFCNSMGLYGKPEIIKNIYGPGSGPIWLDQVSCLGHEAKIDECNHWSWGENNCNHTEDVGLKCTAGPKPNTPRAHRPSSDDSVNQAHDLESTLQLEQSELDDLGLYQGLWQRSSKVVHTQKMCGHFKSNLFDEYEHPEERVVNGSIAKRGRHPWQATIRTRGRGGISSHWCGAVIISRKLILTAAHCLAGYPKGSYFVRVGDHYANIAESSEIDSNIENWYIHEKFRDQKHMNNDIALILLKAPLRFNDYVQPVCLPEKGAPLEKNRTCTISGWGSIKSGTSTPSNILRSAQVPILDDEVCSQKNVYANAMTEGMFCAGFLDESADACDGDSGGPLVCSNEDGETLYGIISWGQHCGYANHPGVYVRVEKYIEWIYEKVNLMLEQHKL